MHENIWKYHQIHSNTKLLLPLQPWALSCELWLAEDPCHTKRERHEEQKAAGLWRSKKKSPAPWNGVGKKPDRAGFKLSGGGYTRRISKWTLGGKVRHGPYHVQGNTQRLLITGRTSVHYIIGTGFKVLLERKFAMIREIKTLCSPWDTRPPSFYKAP